MHVVTKVTCNYIEICDIGGKVLKTVIENNESRVKSYLKNVVEVKGLDIINGQIIIKEKDIISFTDSLDKYEYIRDLKNENIEYTEIYIRGVWYIIS